MTILYQTQLYHTTAPSAAPVLYRAEAVITVTEALAMHTTPITLAEGIDGHFIIPTHVVVRKVQTDAFTSVGSGDDLQVRTTDASGAHWTTVELTGFADGGVGNRVQVVATATTANAAEDDPLVGVISGSQLTGGGTGANIAFRITTQFVAVRL